MSAMLKMCILITQMVAVFSDSAPVKKCKISDSVCLKNSAQNAIPVFVAGMQSAGAEVLDPMKLDLIKVDLAGLKMNMDNVIVKGLKRAVIDKISVDMDKKQALLSWDTDTLTKGHYKASGRLLILPISGDGEMAIKLREASPTLMGHRHSNQGPLQGFWKTAHPAHQWGRRDGYQAYEDGERLSSLVSYRTNLWYVLLESIIYEKAVLLLWDTDTLTKGHYKASGRLLILPISGDGEMAIKLNTLTKGHYKASGRLLILPISGDAEMAIKLNTLTKGYYKASGRLLILPISGDGDMAIKLICFVGVDMKKKPAQLLWDTDTLTKGHYKDSGRLLILPISGDGDMAIKLKKLHVDMMINFAVSKNKEGKDFIDLKNYKYNFDVKENAHFDVTGLFKGNKALSETMLRFMNENWKLLSAEFGRPMLEKPNKKIFETLQNYFRSRALEDLAYV
ncbi:hypothetical protein NE865_12931 [Phthorimaea operculella]|nr:hypothetical protein NE865_12931 [Phthorimaea operculella]